MMEQPGLFHVDAVAPNAGASASKAGPKGQADMSPIYWDTSHGPGVESLIWFCEEYLTIPRGHGAGGPMKLRPWQVEMCSTLYNPSTSIAVWVLPRGQGKSGISAAIALHWLFNPSRMGGRVAVVAQDERSAIRLLKTAARMVELNPQLAARATIYRDRIVIPGTDSELVALPAEAHRVEGSDLDLAILDEIGFMPSATYEAAVFSVGKVAGGKVLGIGTPSPARFREVSPLWDLVVRGRADSSDKTFQLVEYGAPANLPIDSPDTWALANPAYGDWLKEESIRAQLPPLTREIEFRRARLGQWVESSSEPAFIPDRWAKCARPGVRIPRGTRVVLALDGSVNGDSTAIVVGSISSKPHFEVGGLWEPHKSDNPDEQVSHLEVEQRVLDLAKYFEVVEVVADPFRWQRSLQVLSEAGLPVGQFPQTTHRITPATNDLRAAVNNGLITHCDDKDLNSHALRASVEETTRGLKLGKPSAKEKIDLAVCLVMAYSRCQWLGQRADKRKKRVKAFKR